jgi:hypothetical protein
VIVQVLFTLHISIHVASVYINCKFAVQFDRNVIVGAQVQTIFVVLLVSGFGQFVVVLHVYHAFVAVILLHTSQ